MGSFSQISAGGGGTQHNPWSLMGKGNFSTPFGADSDQYVNRSLTQAQRDYLMAGLDAEDELQARLASPPPWLAQIMGVPAVSLARFEEELEAGEEA